MKCPLPCMPLDRQPVLCQTRNGFTTQLVSASLRIRLSVARYAAVGAVFCLWMAGVSMAAPPDLTLPGTVVDTTLTYNLGPTGARGWIYYQKPDAAPVMTRDSRQILVASIEAGSPAAGVLQVGDVIVGVHGALFTSDCRKAFGVAIGVAEASSTGFLNLRVWRAGVTSDMIVPLAIKGLPYSATAPYNCPKSTRILHEGCEYILNHNDWSENNIGAMALLASGDPAYASIIQTKMQAGILNQATRDQFMTGEGSGSAWSTGYRGWTLAEYYLATGDATVLPSVEAYAVASARGRGKFGTFGHGGMSGLNPDGSLHGPVNGYGPMNQVTIPNILSMILAKKCGVSHPELDPAIAVAYNFYTFYCDKGLIPYGEHVPSLTANEDNGRQALAAVMFSFDPAKIHETNYFCRMAMASGDQRENGHTGPYFGYFWEPLGVNIGGPDAMAAYFSDLAWWYDLNRRWDGSFAYVEGDGSPAGLTYRGWTMTPAAMLHYAVPLKKLYMTGKNLSPALALTSAERAESMAASKFTLEHAASPKTTAQLTAALSSFSPAIRNNWAAGYLAADPNHPSVAQLTTWALGSDARLAEGACATLGFLKDPASTPTLTSLLSSPNRSLRIMASRTLDNMDESARPAAVDMLNAIITNQMPLDPMSSDPLQQATSELANGLFYDNTGLLSKSFTGYDRTLVVNAIRVLMQSPDSWARRCLYDVLDLLTFEEIKNLGPVLIDAVQYKAPANGMASKSIRISGSKVLAKYRVVEGIPIIANLMELFEWGKDWFQEEELKALLVYGGSLNFMPGPNLDIYNRVQTIEDFWLDKAGPTDEHVITARQIREKMANDPAASPLVYLLNQPPVANNSAFWVYENTGIATSVGTVLANDVVPSDTLTFSISAGNTGGAFAINSSTGAITVAGALNYATLPTYNLTVTVTDSGLLTATAAVTISVYPVNHGSNNPPVVNDQSFALNENTSIGSNVGTVTSSDPNAGDIRTYAITAGNTGGAFSINSLTGQISVAAGLDFETKPSYVLTLAVTDGLLTDTAAITITINNVNDSPVAAAQSVSTAEDTAKTITLQATDIENSPLTYAIVTFPSHAALSGTPPNLTYTPDVNFNGPDSFTFKANDGALDSVPATVTITVTAVNDAPVAYDQSVSLPQNVATKITLVGDDVEGSTLTYTNVTQPTHGTLGTGAKPTYTPAAGFSGIDSFTFKCNDGSLDSNVATVTITVTGGTNQPPVAAALSVSTAEDTPKPITLLATDANGDALNYSILTQPASGSLSGIAPNVTYTPAANYNGIASFTFKANDGSVDSNVATVTITVTAVNDAPVATSQSVSTSKNTAKTITLQATDIESSPLTYTTITQPAHGSLGGSAPNLTYTPATGYTGPDSFTFKANDGTLDSAPATLIITVTVVNDAPVAIAQSVSTPEDTAKAITLLATDADGNPLTYATVAQPAHGTLSGIVPNVTYTPAPNYNGSDSFTFMANDGLVDSLPATVTITVTAINDAPVATAQNVSTAKNTAKAITLTATDPDNNPLTYATVTSPTHGTLSGTAPNLSYTPTTDYTGADSFTFKANDGSLDSAPAIVTLTVTSGSTWVSTDIGSGQLPGSLSINGGTFTQAGSGTLLMASPASDTLRFTYQVLSGDGEISARIPVLQDTGTSSRVGVMIRETLAPGSKYFFVGMTGSNGSRSSLRSITDESQSGKTYTAVTVPNSWVRLVRSGGTLSVYTSTDGSSWGTTPLRTSNMSLATIVYIGLAVNSGSDTTLNTSQFDHVYLSGSGSPVNYAPVATAQSTITSEDTAIPIILTATDANTDPLTYAIGTSPAHGTLSGTAPILTYTPEANYYGSDSFTFMANDGTFDSAPATITLTITAVNDAPVATSQSISTAEDTAHAITLAGTDVEGNALTYVIVTPPAHGILSGTLPNLTYTPMANYNGSDSFTFKANDGLIESAMATTVTISVTAVNDPPVATSQSAITPEDTPLPISLAATDVDNDALTYATITQPAHGALSGTAPNLIYTPAANYNGADSFTFKANDGTIDSAPASVTITVTPVNDPPVANNTAFNINENSDPATLVGTVTASDPDAGDTRTYAITAGNTGGAFAISSLTGQISVAGALDHESIPIYDLSVTVTDSGQLTAIADIIITVDDINEPPVAMPQSISMGPNTTKGIILHATDPENDPLTYTVVTQPAHGTLSGTAPNKSYTPSTSYTGPDSFTFVANDGIFDSLPATVTITITAGSNAAPVATAQSVSTEQNTAKPITLLATDADANPLTYTVVTQPAHGTLSGNTPNLSYTPATGYTGADSFTFKANDGTADSAAAVVTISVTAPTGLPAPWQTTDVGSSMLAGSVTYNAGTFTQAGSGTLLMNVSPIADTFRFTYQILSGDGMIIAKIPVFQYTGSSSRVGVMLRESLAPGSRFVLSGLTESNAYRWTRRTTTDAKQTSTNYGYGIAPNIWVCLVRNANSIYGYTSPDGTTWTATGTSTMVLPSNVYIGLAVNSGSDATLNTSQFSNVTVSGTIITPLGTYSSWAASNIVTGGETGDADHDGLTNLEEYTLGTDPHISNLSLLALAPAAANSFTLTFQGRAASGTGYEGLTRKYDVQVSSDLAPGSWQNLSGYTSIIGSGQSVVVTLPIAQSRKFYRLNVHLE